MRFRQLLVSLNETLPVGMNSTSSMAAFSSDRLASWLTFTAKTRSTDLTKICISANDFPGCSKKGKPFWADSRDKKGVRWYATQAYQIVSHRSQQQKVSRHNKLRKISGHRFSLCSWKSCEDFFFWKSIGRARRGGGAGLLLLPCMILDSFKPYDKVPTAVTRFKSLLSLRLKTLLIFILLFCPFSVTSFLLIFGRNTP